MYPVPALANQMAGRLSLATGWRQDGSYIQYIQHMNKLNKVTGHVHVIITGLPPPAESTMGQLYGEREPPTTDIRWSGERTLAVFGGKAQGGGRKR